MTSKERINSSQKTARVAAFGFLSIFFLGMSTELGLSADGKSFYNLCGSNLSMEMLAESMLASGIFNGKQLDINSYWVHFVAVRDRNNIFSIEPLFPDMMFENIDRYLYAYSRDYFYVTLAK